MLYFFEVISLDNLGLVKFAKSKIGTPYVYGMKGSLLTEEKYEQLRAMYGDLVWKSDRKKIGKVCVDCSGLISWYTGIVRGSIQYKTAATSVHPISTVSKAPVGALVWQQGHIGIYVGNGEYVAADGSAYGVRRNKLSKAKFTHWFLCTDIAYINIKEEKRTVEKRYNTVNECPEWAKPTIQKLVSTGKIADGNKLDMSEDMLRVLVIMNR